MKCEKCGKKIAYNKYWKINGEHCCKECASNKSEKIIVGKITATIDAFVTPTKKAEKELEKYGIHAAPTMTIVTTGKIAKKPRKKYKKREAKEFGLDVHDFSSAAATIPKEAIILAKIAKESGVTLDELAAAVASITMRKTDKELEKYVTENVPRPVLIICDRDDKEDAEKEYEMNDEAEDTLNSPPLVTMDSEDIKRGVKQKRKYKKRKAKKVE